MSEKWELLTVSQTKQKLQKLGQARLHYAGTMGWQMEYFIPGAIAIVKA